MVKRKQIRDDGSGSKEPLSKRKEDVHKSSRGEQEGNVEGPSKGRKSSSKKSRCTNATGESEILPKEHVGSRFCDSRVYVPTVEEFTADIDQGSMLDEVSWLPLEDLTSLMCGNIVYSLIKNTALGADLTKACAELQEKHARLNLREIANTDSVRKRSVRLLRYERCDDEFLAPSAICKYIELMLLSVINRSLWRFNVREFCGLLSQSLVLARPGVQLMDSSFYNFKIHQLGQFSLENFADIREQGGLTDKELKQLLESLQANILRFLVLYCVHGFRDQVLTRFSNSGEVMYKLKYPAPVNTVITATESDEILKECIPLDDDYIPCLKDLKNGHCNNGSSLRFQVAHLPIPQIVRLVLGEALYSTISTTLPTFLVHLEEYATILKTLQSSSVHKRLFGMVRRRLFRILHNQVPGRYIGSKKFDYLAALQLYPWISQIEACELLAEGIEQLPSHWNEKDVLSMRMIGEHIYHILASINDWCLKAKIKFLMKLLKQRLCELKAQNNEQQLWKSQDCDEGSPKLYFPLKRFAKNLRLLSRDLSPRICRRFNHFFMVYAIDALREIVLIKEKNGNIQFCLDHHPLYKQSCTRCSVVPSFDKLVVEKDSPDSRVPAPSKKLTSATPADEDWELKFYERVKQDPAVPSYFKTTFGILVANNRDLRAERAFLHNHLNRN